MKKISTLLFFFFPFYAYTQVFTGAGGVIQNNGQETYFNFSVSGLSQAQLDNIFGIEEVCINITHPDVRELSIFLKSPSGTIVQLAEGSSSNGANYINTCFNNWNTSVTLATAPYTGTYKPIGFLGRFNNGQAGNGAWKLIVKDYLLSADSGSVISWSVKFSSSPVPTLVFTDSNLPIVVINTNSQQLSDNKIIVDMGIIYNGVGNRNYLTDPLNNYNGKARIGFRGSSSKIFEKKPYSFKTSDAAGIGLSASLLGMPTETDWNLIAMYQDKSLIRIPLTYDLWREMGHYAARFKSVEVVLNNEYQGVYILTEKLKRDSCRINVPKLTPSENTSPGITGGYIFKIDRPDEPGWTSLFPGVSTSSVKFFYQYVYPKPDSITVQQKDYIKNFVDSFETAMNSPYYADPWIGYKKYIAVGSFVDFFIINELSKNVDSYRLSTYMYKNKITKGGKLHIGPVWDYDLGWHNCNYGNAFDPNYWQYQIPDDAFPSPTWWTRFMQDTNFVNAVYCRWTELRQGVLSNNYLNAYIDSSVLALNESQQRNFIQWPVLGAYIFANPQNQTNATYQTEINDLKTWVTNRIGWLDWAIQGSCPIIGIEENSSDNYVSVYPNPSMGKFTISSSLTISSVEIINLLGERVTQSVIPGGAGNLSIDLGEEPKGLYFYHLKTNAGDKTGKIIIQ